MRARAGYVLVGTLKGYPPRHPPPALRASGSGWSAYDEPQVFRSRPEAIGAALRERQRYTNTFTISVMLLRDWDRLRIQAVISAP